MNIAIVSLGWTLLHSVWEGAVIWVVLRAALVVLARRSARARCFVSSIALTAMMVAFFFTFSLVNASELRKVPEMVANLDSAQAVHGSNHGAFVLPQVGAIADFTNGAGATRILFPVMVLLWTIGCIWRAASVALSWKRTRDLAGKFRSRAPSWLEARCEGMARELGIKRAVQIGECILVNGPSVVGWFKPMILVPVGAFSGLSPVQVDALLAHEFAHILRNDFAANLLQSVCEVVFFYHPAVWAISHEIRIERENACDDVAVKVTGDPRAYAAALAELEEGRCPPVLLAANGGDLLSRVSRLLLAPTSPKKGAVSVSWLTLVGVAATFALVVAPSLASRLLATSSELTVPSAQSSSGDGTEYPFRINIVLTTPGWGHFATGDNITITSVQSDRKHIEVGGTYLVEGTYHLRSMKEATIGLSVTAPSPESPGATSPVDARQRNYIKEGNGHFSLLETMHYDGSFHVSFNPINGGQSRGTVYFGESEFQANNPNRESTRIVIAVRNEQPVEVNGKAIADDQLRPLLRLAHDAYPSVPVLLITDENTPLTRLTFVIESCRTAGLMKFSLQSR